MTRFIHTNRLKCVIDSYFQAFFKSKKGFFFHSIYTPLVYTSIYFFCVLFSIFYIIFLLFVFSFFCVFAILFSPFFYICQMVIFLLLPKNWGFCSVFSTNIYFIIKSKP